MKLLNTDCPNAYNGYCNDESNIAKCNYDGGDCCGTCVITNHCSEYCSDCICYHQENCAAGVHPLVGNGYCNDETNNVDCNYDGGDCCGTCVNTDQCSECACHGDIIGDGGESVKKHGKKEHHSNFIT